MINIHEQVVDPQSKLIYIQQYNEDIDPNFVHGEEIELQASLNKFLVDQATLWKQKNRVKWLKFGDRNTTFFHKNIQKNKSKHLLQVILVDGVSFTNMADIRDNIPQFYSELFTHPSNMGSIDHSWIAQLIPNCIAASDFIFQVSLQARKSGKRSFI